MINVEVYVIISPLFLYISVIFLQKAMAQYIAKNCQKFTSKYDKTSNLFIYTVICNIFTSHTDNNLL